MPPSSGGSRPAGEVAVTAPASDVAQEVDRRRTCCPAAAPGTDVSKPIGVAALITLWTFPIAIPACKLAPALISGNAVVLDRAARGRGSPAADLTEHPGAQCRWGPPETY